ncbi:MarR family winged helix-turn-helix transcriptional regulator [Streptomyces sp. RPT161]|uniref:MarR family winged helix-turn-helix transcriptional regulator n=1 Tax=Streptomyces sp. RPT161 TaxID=3015993 RepID=UPI0022B8C9E1|nr:MarR family transcriptional regulator [Streptomyces sp. RPT161]
MTDKIAPAPPDPAQLQETLAFVPLLAAFFRRAHTDMPDQLREAFSSHRLTARHGAVLTQLLAQDAIGVSELARRMGLSLSTASELVGDLSRAGWASRREDPADHRRTLVALPEERRPVVEEFVAVRAAPLLRAMDGLSAEQRQGFVAGLRAWAHEVRDW